MKCVIALIWSVKPSPSVTSTERKRLHKQRHHWKASDYSRKRMTKPIIQRRNVWDSCVRQRRLSKTVQMQPRNLRSVNLRWHNEGHQSARMIAKRMMTLQPKKQPTIRHSSSVKHCRHHSNSVKVVCWHKSRVRKMQPPAQPRTVRRRWAMLVRKSCKCVKRNCS